MLARGLAMLPGNDRLTSDFADPEQEVDADVFESEAHGEVEQNPAAFKSQDDVRRYGPLGAALRALFLPSGDPGKFAELMGESISACDKTLVDTAGRSRLRLQDNAYELLAARDVLHESSESLSASAKAAEEASANVQKAQEELAGAVVARKNIDSSLDVVSRTRALLRVYARAEDMTASRRLHTATRALERLDEDLASVPDGAVLTELIPPSEPLRTEMLVHIRRALRLWLTTIHPETSLVGGRALSFARKKLRSAQSAIADVGDSSRPVGAADIGGLSFLEKLPVQEQWIPPVLDDERGIDISSMPSSRFLSALKLPDVSAGVLSGGPLSPHRRSPAGQGVMGGDPSAHAAPAASPPRSATADQMQPKVPMRLLLTCVLTCRDLGHLDSFSRDYQRERAKQLENGIDAIQEVYQRKATPTESSAAVPIAQRCVERHTRLATFVAGFFVVERAVETFSSTQLLGSDAHGALWKYASEKVIDAAADTAHVDSAGIRRIRLTQLAFLSLAKLYGFEMVSSFEV